MSPRPPVRSADEMAEFERAVGDYASVAVVRRLQRSTVAQRRARSFEEFRRIQKTRSGEKPEKSSPGSPVSLVAVRDRETSRVLT